MLTIFKYSIIIACTGFWPALVQEADAAPASNNGLTFVRGELTGPSSSTPAAIGARFFATGPAVLGGANPASLRLEKVSAVGAGQVLRYHQTYRGLRVIGGTTWVRLDGAGRVRWASSGARAIPDTLSTNPSLTARQALARAAISAGYDQAYASGLDATQRTRLVVYAQPNMDAPRLAYWVELPRDMRRLFTARAYVDAESGYIYRLENLVVKNHVGSEHLSTHDSLPACVAGDQSAYVFETNPLETPELSCVSLRDWLPPGARQLGNKDVATGNCIDNNGCREVNLLGPMNLHWCDDDPTATADKDGDFTHYRFESHTALEDDFAEVQMFYHVNKVYEVARSLGGFTDLKSKPIGAVVNFRLPFDIASADLLSMLEQACWGDTYTGGKELYTFDNAFFAPAGALAGYPDEDSIVFGQGAKGDFAYDGDVIYHEFGHAVMNTVAPDLAFGFIDQYGFNPTPGGMHEGYADLMTMFVTDDPEIGEYAGSFFDLEAIRNIQNNATCPDGLVGETHIDSLPITGAIWQARKTVAPTAEARVAFDRAIFAAQQAFGEFEDFGTAAAKTVAEIEQALGKGAADTMAAIFAERGIDDCQNRVVDGTRVKPLMLVGSNGQAQGGPNAMPGPVQFRYDLPHGADSLTIDIEQVIVYVAGLTGEPELSVVLKQGDTINWQLDGENLQGDYTQTLAPTVDSETGAATATLDGPLPEGTYYFQFMVEGGALILRNIGLAHTGGEPPTDPSQPVPTPQPGDSADNGKATGGCVVDNRSTGMGGLVVGLLGLLLSSSLRRRRRS